MDDREWSWHASCFRNHQQAADKLTAMRQTMEDVMSKVIEFYIPDSFPTKVNRIAPNERGKVIQFRLPRGKGLTIQFHELASHDEYTKEGAIPMWIFSI